MDKLKGQDYKAKGTRWEKIKGQAKGTRLKL